MAITIKDVAKKAGVGITTVSRALNDKSEIRQGTKDLILKVCKELGYKPNRLAKSLVTRKSNTIGVLIPDSMDAFFSEMVQGIADECLENGYSIVLSHTQSCADKELEYIRLLQEKRMDGMLIYPVQEDDRYIKELKNSTIPFVLLNRYTEALDCDYVINDSVHGAYLAVDHLIQKGHKLITYLCAKPATSTAKERILGCKKAITENGLEISCLKIVTCKPTIESSYINMKKLIMEKQKTSAVFVWDDKLAIGVRKAIFEAGFKIPKDVSLVGYNDIEIAKYLSPPLTTIRQATYQIGETAARILLDTLNSDCVKTSKQIILKPELIVREST